MKNTILPSGIRLLVLCSYCAFFFSCTREYEDGTDRSVYTLSDRPVGSQEEIPTGGASARFEGSYDAGRNTLQYQITWNALNGAATAVHFHGPATAGNPSGTHSLMINAGEVQGNATGSIVISEAEEAELLQHRWFFDVHTSSQTEADIRKPIYASPY